MLGADKGVTVLQTKVGATDREKGKQSETDREGLFYRRRSVQQRERGKPREAAREGLFYRRRSGQQTERERQTDRG